MPPLNWDEVAAIDPDNLEDQADDWYSQLQTVQIDKEDNVEHLRALCKLSVQLLQIKHTQAEVAMEEVDNLAQDRAKLSSEREQELVSEVAELKEQISTLRRQALNQGDGNKDTQLLRDEIKDLEKQNRDMTKELHERERELVDEKQTVERLTSQAQQTEKDIRDIKRERDQLLADMKEYQRQIDTHRETTTARRSDDEETQKKLRQKNQEMLQLLDEINNLSTANESLQNQTNQLKKSLEESVQQMEKTTDQYIQMREALEEADMAIEALETENKLLHKQLVDDSSGAPGQSVDAKGLIESELLAAIDHKIQEWRTMISDKDSELESYKQQVQQLRDELHQYSIDTDRVTVVTLTRAVQDKDKQIETLKTELTKAAVDMQSSSDIMEELRNQLSLGGNATESQKRRMLDLQSKLKTNESNFIEATKRADMAEKSALEKDMQLSELLNQLQLYERGEYGLSEAVQEIKQWKQQVKLRDKQVEELVQHVNKIEVEINNLLDENAEFRAKLKLDPRKPLDVELKYSQKVRKESDRALNIVLQKEVERLEEERLQLKSQLRKLAQATGQRAVALGLTADDLVTLERFTEDLKEKKEPAFTSTTSTKTRIEQAKSEQLSQDYIKQQKLTENIYSDNKALRKKVQDLETENLQLVKGLKEIRTKMPEGGYEAADGHGFDVPSLDKLLSIFETRELTGNIDATLQMKSQLDHLTGRNDELRAELRQMRGELQVKHADFDKVRDKAAKLEQEVASLTTAGGSLQYKAIQLPEGLPVSSSMLIMNLNEQLVQILQELTLKNEQLVKLEEVADVARRKITVLKHQQGLLYQEHHEKLEGWSKDKKILDDKVQSLQGKEELLVIKVQEFDRMIDTLAQDEREYRRRLAELTRKYTLLRINERTLIRRCNLLIESEDQMRKDSEVRSKEALKLECTVQERLNVLHEQREMNKYKIAALQRAVDDSVPKRDYDAMQRQFDEMTDKYRNLLQRESTLVDQSRTNVSIEEQLKEIAKENTHLKKILETEKEKLHRAEVLLEWNKRDISESSTSSGYSSVELDSVARKMSILEMKELNEREKANHAQMMYEQQNMQLRKVEDRNIELEENIEKLNKLNFDLESSNKSLQEELAGAVSKSVYETLQKRVEQQEMTECTLKTEIDTLKTIADIARLQYASIEKSTDLQRIELTELRSLVRDVQAEGDKQAIIGKLHREIIHMKLTESETGSDLKAARSSIANLEKQLQRSEYECFRKDSELQSFRTEYQAKIAQLRRTIQSLRVRYSGTISLKDVEKFSATLGKLQQERDILTKEALLATQARQNAEAELQDIKCKRDSLEELLVTLKEPDTGTKKILEWQQKIEELRLKDLSSTRHMERIQEQLKSKETLLRSLEVSVTSLEEENVKLSSELEKREMQWDLKETDMEKRILSLQRYEKADRDQRLVESVATYLPDASKPLAIQLSEALDALKQQSRNYKLMEVDLEKHLKKIGQLESVMRDQELELTRKDRLLKELRTIMPKTASLDTTTDSGISTITQETAQKSEFYDKSMRETMQAALHSLQERLTQKEEYIQVYQKAMHKLEDNMKEMQREHLDQVRQLREKIYEKTEERVQVMRQQANDLVLQSQDTERQNMIMQMAVLEDTVEDRESVIAGLTEKLKEANEGRRQAERELDNLKLANSRRKDKDTAVKKSSIVASEPDKQSRSPQIGKGDVPGAPPSHVSVISTRSAPASVVDGIQASISKAVTTDRSEQASQIDRPTLPREIDIDSVPITPSTVVEVALKKLEVLEINEQMVREEKQEYLTIKNTLDKTKRRLTEVRKENEALRKANVELRNDLLSAKPPKPSSGMRDLELKNLKTQNEDLEEKVAKTQRDNRKLKEREEELISENEELRGDLTLKKNEIGKLKEQNKKLNAEVEQLETRISHLRDSVKMKLQETENNQLKKKVTTLEQKLQELKKWTEAERPLDQEDATTSKLSKEEVARWSETKKLTGQIEKLKQQLTQQKKETDDQKTMVERLRTAVTRLETEKLQLDKELKQIQKSTKKDRPTPEVPRPTGKSTVEVKQPVDDAVLFLQEQNRDLHEQLHELREQLRLVVSREAELKERNKVLEHERMKVASRVADIDDEFQSVAQEEQQYEVITTISSTAGTTEVTDIGVNFSLFDPQGKTSMELQEMVMALRGMVRQLQAENDQLKTVISSKEDGVQAVISAKLADVRHLQERLAFFEEENRELRDELEDRMHPMGNIETVNRLHTLVDQLEAEKKQLIVKIEDLKFSRSGPDNGDMERLLRENRELKEKMNKSAPRVVWAEEFALVSRSQAAVKLANENERLQRELRQEQAETEKLRQKVSQLQAANQRMEQELGQYKSFSANKRQWRPEGVGGLYEGKLKDKESQLHKQTSRVTQLENVMKQETEKYQKLLVENRRMQQKLQTFEWKADRADPNDLEMQIRNSKREILQARAEIEDLRTELDILNKSIKPAILNTQEVDIVLLTERMKTYELILRENIDLKLETAQLKSQLRHTGSSSGLLLS